MGEQLNTYGIWFDSRILLQNIAELAHLVEHKSN